MFKKFKSFTIVEVLAVLAIIAILIGLSVFGMGIFRRTVEIEQAKSDLLSSLRFAQNLSRNSVSSAVKSGDLIIGKVDAYAIYFDTNNYSLHYCVASNRYSGLQYDCSGIEDSSLRPDQFKNALVSFSNNHCKGVIFERLTGEIYGMTDFIGSPTNTGVCSYLISHSQGTDTRQINVNLTENNISE